MDSSCSTIHTSPFSALTEQLSGRRSRAWDITDRAVRMERDGHEIIHLGVGDPDFDTPPNIVDAAISSIRDGRTHYSPAMGEPVLRSAIAKSASRQVGFEVDPGQVCIFPGAQCALFATMICLTGPGDEVILLEPFYATYEGVASAGGASVVPVPLSAETGFELDIGRITAAITGKTRVILANAPNNPSGAVFSEESWASLVDLCATHDIWLISDEVYSDLVYDGEHYSALGVPAGRQRTVVIGSVSKSYAMTGWRLGWAIAPHELAAHLGNLAQVLLFGVSQFTQDAAAYAIQNARAEADNIRRAFRSRRDLLCDAFGEIEGIVVHRPAGGMFVMVDVSALGCDGEEFANALLDEKGVAIVPGFAFGDSMTQFVRIGYLHDEEVLKRAADKIADFVSGL